MGKHGIIIIVVPYKNYSILHITLHKIITIKQRKESTMKKYMSLILAIAILLLPAAVGCTQKPPENNSPTPSDSPQLELTLEELAAYNGKEGKPAYVAVDGIIYDVSGSSRWKNGEHNGYSAGQDLTDIIKNKSPHGVSVLSRMPAVGKIVE